jgi:hypothetical protein
MSLHCTSGQAAALHTTEASNASVCVCVACSNIYKKCGSAGVGTMTAVGMAPAGEAAAQT